MAEIHGVAGEWARVKGTVFGLWPMFVCVFVAGFAMALGLAGEGVWGASLFVVALVGFFIAMRFGLRRVERFYKGARGEERVAGILRELPARYHVFNDFVAEGVHVDHVVVGPAGVFSIETKNWKDEVTIEDGHVLVGGRLPTHPPLAQAVREAALVKTALVKAGWTGEVTPVLAFASDTFRAHSAVVPNAGGAVIINACDLAKSFETDRVVMPPAELDRLVSLMENNS